LNKIFQPLATGDDEMLVARYGGEEFSIVLCGELASRAATFAEIIRKTAGKTLLLPSQQKGRGSQEKQSLTVSLGVSALCQGWKGNYQTRLIDSADKALYKAKDNGRNCTAQFIDGRYKIVSSR